MPRPLQVLIDNADNTVITVDALASKALEILQKAQRNGISIKITKDEIIIRVKEQGEP